MSNTYQRNNFFQVQEVGTGDGCGHAHRSEKAAEKCLESERYQRGNYAVYEIYVDGDHHGRC